MSSIPEHNKRDAAPGVLHPEIAAAYNYVESVKHTTDSTDGGPPMWYGWALREAFLAGISHAREKVTK